MGRAMLALVGCLVATAALIGCGGDKSQRTGPGAALPPSSEASNWTCGDFRSASSAEHSEALKTLAVEVSKITGNPPGEGKKVAAAIERLCAGAPADKPVGSAAVEVVAAAAEEPTEEPAEATTTTTTTTTTTPAETTTETAPTTTHATTTGAGSGSGNTYCYEADAPNAFEPGCQGYYGPPPSGSG